MRASGANPLIFFLSGALLLFAVLAGVVLLNENQLFLKLILGFSGLCIFIYLLLFQKELLVYLTFIVVPLSIPLDLPGGIRISFPSEILMVVMGGFFLMAVILRPILNRKVLRHPLTILIFADLYWLLITSIYSSMPEVSFKRIAIKAGFVIFFYLFMVHWFRKPRNMVIAFLLYAAGTLPVILFSMKKHAAYNFIPQVSFNICEPFYQDHTVYGASLAFILPFLFIVFFKAGKFGFSRVLRTVTGLVLLIVLAGEVLSFSRAAMLSLAAAMIFFVLLKLKIRFSGLLILLATFLVFGYVQKEAIYERVTQNESLSNKGDIKEHFKSVGNIQSDASNLERINRWVCAIEMFKEKQVTGYGPGTYQFEYGKYQSFNRLTYISTFTGDRGNAHSEYFTYLSETGLPGFLIFLILVFYTILTGLKVYYQPKDEKIRLIALGALLGLVTFFVHGLVNAFIEQDKMAALVFPAMAMLVAIDIYHKCHSFTASQKLP